MIISSSAPQELISWFHATQHSADVFCILLAPSTTDQEQIAGLIDDLYAADAVLGEAVSFLLLHPDVHSPLGLHKGMGAFDTLQGMYFPPGELAGRPRVLYSMIHYSGI